MIGRLVVVGLGLIGGSFAKGLRESGLCSEVVGVDLDPQSRKLAVELGWWIAVKRTWRSRARALM